MDKYGKAILIIIGLGLVANTVDSIAKYRLLKQIYDKETK